MKLMRFDTVGWVKRGVCSQQTPVQLSQKTAQTDRQMENWNNIKGAKTVPEPQQKTAVSQKLVHTIKKC